MASSINPNNIDGTYPVAGQDNNSQGFRDNFTNTKSNFEFAAAEITDLQNKAVLKAALTGTILNNNMNGAILSNAQLQNIKETVVSNLPTTGTVTINYAAGSYQQIPQTTGSVSLSFSNFPPAGQLARVRVQIFINNISHKLILPATVSVGTNNIQGYADSEITFNQTGRYEFEFETSDGGLTLSLFDLNRNRDPIYLPSVEEINSGDAISLTETATYFSTTGSPATATLATGSAGQVKVLSMLATNGDMVVTVANAGWKSSGTGTVTFSSIGQACTLMYINSKWFCIGNNGAVFA